MKKPFAAGLVITSLMIAGLLLLVACAGPSTAAQVLGGDTQLMARQLSQYRLAQPIHFYTYSQDLATMNAIMDARTAGRSTWSAEFLPNVPDPIFTCPSRGYPIPGDSELTNPEQTGYQYDSSGHYALSTVPQIDPNGLYSSHSTNSTYIVCVDTDGTAYVHYSEPLISVWPMQMTWDYTRHMAVKAEGASASYTVPVNDHPAPPTDAQVVATSTPTTQH